MCRPPTWSKSARFLRLRRRLVNGAPVPALIRILSSPQKPDDAFAAVPYRQDWYWIDDKDFPSKRLFSFIMFLFTLTDTGEKQGAPIITIPAGKRSWNIGALRVAFMGSCIPRICDCERPVTTLETLVPRNLPPETQSPRQTGFGFASTVCDVVGFGKSVVSVSASDVGIFLSTPGTRHSRPIVRDVRGRRAAVRWPGASVACRSSPGVH